MCSPKNLAKKLAFFVQNGANICKIWIMTLVFKKKANSFRRKLAEKCDRNSDHCNDNSTNM
jgi:hypothetical protein